MASLPNSLLARHPFFFASAPDLDDTTAQRGIRLRKRSSALSGASQRRSPRSVRPLADASHDHGDLGNLRIAALPQVRSDGIVHTTADLG